MKTLFFKAVALSIFFLGCTTDSIEPENPENIDGLQDNPEVSEENCTGKTDSSNYNFKLFDADFLGWKQIVEGNNDDFSRKFIYNNGVFVCTGTFNETDFSNNGNQALYAVDEDFEPIWTFPEQVGEFYDVIHTSDNNYVAVGRIGNGDVAQIYVAKVNLDGEFIWEHRVEVTDNRDFGAYATTVIENPSGGYVVTGKTSNGSNIFGFGARSFILSLGESGIQQWVKPLSDSSEPSDMIINTNGNFIVVFKTDDVIINEIGLQGDILKEASYGSSKSDGALHVLQLRESNYLITGYTLGEDGDVSKSYGNTDIWVLKLDSNLNLIEERTFGGFGYQVGVYTVEMEDNSLLLCAQSTGNIFVFPASRSPIFLRLSKDLCLIDWDESLKHDDYSLTDVIWLEERNEIVTFSNENDRSNIYDTTDDFYHNLISFKLENN